MKHLTKKLTVKNDGFCNCKKPASERIDAAINRYAEKMQKKGWVPYCGPATGDNFATYEAYVRLCLPTSDEEKAEMIDRAIDHFWNVGDDGILRI